MLAVGCFLFYQLYRDCIGLMHFYEIQLNLSDSQNYFRSMIKTKLYDQHNGHCYFPQIFDCKH